MVLKRRRSTYRKFPRSNRRKPAPFTRRRRRGAAYRGRSRMMKSIALNLAESKEANMTYRFLNSVPPPGGPNPDFYHNNLYRLDLSDKNQTTTGARITNIGTGNGRNQRNGLEIMATGFRIRGTFSVPFDRRNVIIKLWQVEWDSSQGDPSNKSNFFTGGGTPNIMLSPINTDRYKNVKLLRTMRTKSRDLYVERGEVTDSGADATVYYNMWIPFKRKLHYSVSQVTQGQKEYFSLILGVYDTPSTNETTDIVVNNHEQYIQFFYKDP